MPTVTAVLLNHFAVDKDPYCNVVIIGMWGNSGYVYSYCSTVTSLFRGYKG